MCFCVVSVCVLFFFSLGHVPEINDDDDDDDDYDDIVNRVRSV